MRSKTPAAPAPETPATPTPTAAPTVPETLAAPVAEPAIAATAAKVPEKLLRRSAEAKAKATGRPVDEILAELMGGAPDAPSAPAPAPAAPAPAATTADPARAAAAAAIPEHLLRRSAEARAKATGGSADEILAEWMGGTTTEPTPAATPAPAPAAPAPAAAPKAMAAPAAAAKVPEHLLRRSAEAKAKATGQPVEEILAELMAETATAAPIPAAAPEPAAPAAITDPVPDPATEASPPVPESGEPQQLPEGAEPETVPVDGAQPAGTINVQPHLLAIVFAGLVVVLALLAVFSIFRDAHLLELINLHNQSFQCKGLIIGVVSISLLLGSLFSIHYTNLGKRLGFIVTGSALFGFMAIVGLMYTLYAPRGLRPASVAGLNAFQIRMLPVALMLGSLVLFAVFVAALNRVGSEQD